MARVPRHSVVKCWSAARYLGGRRLILAITLITRVFMVADEAGVRLFVVRLP